MTPSRPAWGRLYILPRAQGPVRRHLVAMAVPTAIGMLMQTLYYLVDLYFVGRLGDAALAGGGPQGPGDHRDQLRGRVRETFRSAVVMSSVLMLVLTVACQWWPEWMIAVGALYLSTVSWNFVASGINFCCSGMFQAMGNNEPSLASLALQALTSLLLLRMVMRQRLKAPA